MSLHFHANRNQTEHMFDQRRIPQCLYLSDATTNSADQSLLRNYDIGPVLLQWLVKGWSITLK